MDIKTLQDQRVLVVGMARSGVAAAKLLSGLGAIPVLSDAKTRDQLAQALEPLAGIDHEDRLGEDPVDALPGCRAVVISPGVPIQAPVVEQAKVMGIPVMGELELGFLAARGRIVAITGTNGKTTTTSLLGEMCKNAGKVTHVVGNIGYPITAVALDTRPADVLVVEVSSFQLESVEAFAPAVAACLNISQDHLNRHGTMDTYIATKRRIFKEQKPSDTAVLNWDDPVTRAMAQGLTARVAFFSLTEKVPWGAYARDGEIVLVMGEGERTLCKASEVKIPGSHNLANALAATAMAAALGIPPPVIRHSLRTFEGVEHRIAFVKEVRGVRYINDSKGTNVDSTLKAIASMQAPTVIILGGSDKDVDFAPLANAIRDHPLIKTAILMGETAPKIQAALTAAGYTSTVQVGKSIEKALERAQALTQPGDTVLLSPACASFDMFRDFEHRGDVFKRLVGALE